MNDKEIIGALVFVLYIVFKDIIPRLRSKVNGHGKIATSGEQPIDYWRLEIRQACKDGIAEALLGRNEELRRILREELDRKRR